MTRTRLTLGTTVGTLFVTAVVMATGLAQEPPPSRSQAPEEFAKSILQRKAPDLRRDALEQLRVALDEGSQSSETIWALSTLLKSLSAKFERGPFRTLVLPRLTSNSAPIRKLSLRCLPGLNCTLSDLDAIVPLARDSN